MADNLLNLMTSPFLLLFETFGDSGTWPVIIPTASTGVLSRKSCAVYKSSILCVHKCLANCLLSYRKAAHYRADASDSDGWLELGCLLQSARRSGCEGSAGRYKLETAFLKIRVVSSKC